MKFRPGKNLVLLGIVVLLLAAGSFFMPLIVWAIPVVLVCALPFVVLDIRAVGGLLRGLEVDRSVPAVVGRGRVFRVLLIINSPSPGAVRATIRDEIPEKAHSETLVRNVVLTKGTNEIPYFITIAKRGLHEFGRTWVRVTGPWSLLEAQCSWDIAHNIRVMPPSLVPDDELQKDSQDDQRLLDEAKPTRERGEGTEFESLSEYREGDDIRRIDWRSSARFDRLIVRRFQVERHRDVVILVDCGRHMGTAVGNGTKLDCAVNSALAISGVALKAGDRCGIGVFDSQVRGFLPPVAGTNAYMAVVDRLYDVQPTWQETDFAPMFATLQARQSKRSVLIIISDLMDQDTTERYRAALLALGTRHVVLFAALRTPLLSETVGMPIETAKDVARKTFALRLMKEREVTLHTLKRSGVEVLDVEPANLTIPLINMFLEAKSRTVA